jgi:hypothetical protein
MMDVSQIQERLGELRAVLASEQTDDGERAAIESLVVDFEELLAARGMRDLSAVQSFG